MIRGGPTKSRRRKPTRTALAGMLMLQAAIPEKSSRPNRQHGLSPQGRRFMFPAAEGSHALLLVGVPASLASMASANEGQVHVVACFSPAVEFQRFCSDPLRPGERQNLYTACSGMRGLQPKGRLRHLAMRWIQSTLHRVRHLPRQKPDDHRRCTKITPSPKRERRPKAPQVASSHTRGNSCGILPRASSSALR